MKRRDFCKGLAVTLAAGALAPAAVLPQAGAATALVGRAVPDDYYTLWYRSDRNSADLRHDYYYSDSLFDHPATEYDNQLALATLGMATATDCPWESDQRYWMEGEVGRADHIRDAFAKLGFTEVQLFNYTHSLNDTPDTVACAIARKTLVRGGRQVTIIGAFLRGSGYGAEWSGNLHAGPGSAHTGFVTAARQLVEKIRGYVQASAKRQPLGTLKLWMGGYSRGGGVTNLVAARLPAVLPQLEKKNTYVYTFAAPAALTAADCHEFQQDFDNNHTADGRLKKDWDTMIAVGDITHYLGDAICLVAAETPELLEQAKALVEVEYEELPAVHSPREAILPDAPLVHRDGNLLAHKHIQRGNPAEAIAKAKYMLTERFSTPWTEHAFLEPECAVAYPEGKGVTVLSTDQGAYDTQHEIMGMLGLPAEQVRVRNCLVGGGFGGKEDVTVQHHAALIAYLTKRPVKVKLTRAESLLIHPKRHPMEMEFSLGCDENGIIQGVAAECIADTGAYASLGGPVLERACTHGAGPYHYEAYEIDGWAYYTNNPPAGAFRGFGVTQTCFCIESLLNRMADMVGISPWEIRWRNAIRPGEVLPNGQIVDASTGLAETLEAIKPYYDEAVKNGDPVGLACAMKNAGVGVGIPDTGRVRLTVQGGKVHIFAGASCIGQGLGTVLTQIVCGETGLSPENVVYERSNTWMAPDSGTTSGSRQTLFTGEACYRACKGLKDALADAALSALEGKEFYGEYLGKTDPLGAKVPNPVSHIAYGYATQLCVLDKDTGRIKHIVAAHDVGKAVNPTSVEGQIEGGVVMSMGYALTERYPIDENCRPTAKFGTLGLFRANQIPEIIPIIVEKPGLNVGGGAIGIGEITSIPTAPAIADAYYRYDGEFRTSLPLKNTPYAKK